MVIPAIGTGTPYMKALDDTTQFFSGAVPPQRQPRNKRSELRYPALGIFS